ncbi:hypothetical protein KQX54_021567 [Cotesia glomerata]|uniref:Uncharacterized protein n=1 Tax=Cotesia glomerata TaxID=32391 RepID=A0AAV7J8W7_COTGL|nr:hypothetical protein KQX54_021567 [Cotesia glomerata]
MIGVRVVSKEISKDYTARDCPLGSEPEQEAECDSLESCVRRVPREQEQDQCVVVSSNVSLMHSDALEYLKSSKNYRLKKFTVFLKLLSLQKEEPKKKGGTNFQLMLNLITLDRRCCSGGGDCVDKFQGSF